jgi:hypothetical protein
MRADGRGRRNAVERASELRHLEQLEQERQRTRAQIEVPLLSTVVQVKKFVIGEPELPIVSIAPDIPIRSLGKAIFGKDGYNRVKSVSEQGNIGPHFDAYARHFAPWALHVNGDTVGTIRGVFLPRAIWRDYLKRTDTLAPKSMNNWEADNRGLIGKEAMDGAAVVYTSKLEDGSRTLIWHGSIDQATTPPSVHEVYRRPSITASRDLEVDFMIYTRQNEPGEFEGFVEV